MSFKRRVYFRIFPTEKLNFELIKIDTKLHKVYIRHMQDLAPNAFVREASYWEFNTNGVFFNATQDKVYTEIKADLLENVIKGYSGVIIAFGQTGTGKSFTTSGLHFSDEEFGIAPRMAKELLHLKRDQPSNIKMCIQMSYVEFNNANAVDLLDDLPNTLEIYKCRDAKKVKVLNEYDALKCLYTGEGHKNYVNKNSQYLSNVCSTVITFHITTKNMDLTNPTKTCSRIHIVDLAGNDSCANISALKTHKEIGLANVTKSQLEQFILRLAQNIPENIRIQQRMNVLIYYLDGDFSCQNILRFIGHIRARSEDMLVSLSMLRFAHVVQGLKTRKKHIKFDMNEEVELEILRKKLETYDKEKHLNSVLLNIDLVSGLNPPRIAHLNNLIQNYLSDNIGEITVMNVADTKIVLRNMKEMYINCQNEVKKLQNDNQNLSNKSDTSLKPRGSKTSSQGSASKISRKSSKVRSRESFVKEKRTSASNMSDKRLIAASDDQAVITELTYSSKRKKSRSGTSGGITKTSSQNKNKKSSNTSVNRQESRSSIRSFADPTLPIPDLIPEKREVWRQYVNHGTYKDKVDEYKQNEKEVKESFIAYVRELKKLQVCKQNINKCSKELIVAQTYRRFNAEDEFDEDGLLVISFAEKQCKDHLEEAKQAQLIQQERVLRNQEELKILLDNRQNIIKKIDEEFEQFARERYKIPSVTSQDIEEDLKEITFDVDLDHPEESLEENEEIITVPAVPDQTLMIRRLQRFMYSELEKRKRAELEKKHKFKLF